MTSPCAKHPHQPLVGVCASCLREKLALCMSSLGKCGGGGGEAESANNEAFGSSIIVSKGIGNGSPILRDINKRTLSYYLENIQGVSSNCNVHASHRKSISSDALYQGNSFYASNHYVPQGRHEGSYLKGAKENSSFKESPTLSDGFSKGRPLSWFSALFSKREEKQKADSRESSIASWKECSKESVCEGTYHQYDSRCTHSFSSEAPSWEHLFSWGKKPTRSLSSQSTRSPLELPPLLSSTHSTRYPLPPLLSSQSTRSPLKLHPSRSSPRSPLKLPPLLSYPRSPLKLLSSKPTIACDVNSQPQTVSPQLEEDPRSGIPSKKKEIWFGFFLRNKWFVRFKRHFAKKKKQEDAESVRTSSADCSRHSLNHYLVQSLHSQSHWFTEKNQCRHSQNHWFMEKNHFQNQRSAMLNRPLRAGREAEQRWGSGSGRDYAGWESYFSNSFNGLQVRHRYHSADCAEMLRFYLTPVRKLRSPYYY